MARQSVPESKLLHAWLGVLVESGRLDVRNTAVNSARVRLATSKKNTVLAERY